MIKQQKEENNVSKCGFLCGHIAIGVIKITENTTSLQLCDTCHHLVDANDTMAWIPF
ncbi:MAG: hypothetical protein ACJ71K_10235 [Nitrososphaeraceae archaeon]|jgi:hypothetical protein